MFREGGFNACHSETIPKATSGTDLTKKGRSEMEVGYFSSNTLTFLYPLAYNKLSGMNDLPPTEWMEGKINLIKRKKAL